MILHDSNKPLPDFGNPLNKRNIKQATTFKSLTKYLTLTISLACTSIANAQEDFTPIFNGVNLDGWYTFDNQYGRNNDVENYYKVENGELVILDIPETDEDKAFGYISTESDYSDYHLRFEYQWGEKKFAPRANLLRDSGVLYHLIGNDRIWPTSLESQVQEGDTGDFFGLGGTNITTTVSGNDYSPTGTLASTNSRASSVADTLTGWNTSEVIVRGDSAVHIVNGIVVNRIWDAEFNGNILESGRIGFQAEGATIRYRNIELRPLFNDTPRILLFSETQGFTHSNIPAALNAIDELASSAGMQVDQADDSEGVFTDTNLAQYDAVVWVSTTGDVLNDDEQSAFEQFIRSGGGYAGIHAASDTEYNWPWYGELVGAYFDSHPAQQTATMEVEDHNHSSTEHLGNTWTRFDEWYNFQDNPRSSVNVLLSLDESSYSGGSMGDDHPIAWYHEFDGGRSWYTGGGHTEDSFAEDDFRAHILGGIQYAVGRTAGEGGSSPTDAPSIPADALSSSDWILTASNTRDDEQISSAIDSNINTRWSSGTPQNPDMWFQIDMGEAHEIDGIVLDAGSNVNDYPRDYEILVSDNGVDFTNVATGSGNGRGTEINFDAIETRFIRIAQTGSSDRNWWSIHEMYVSAAATIGEALDRSDWTATATPSAEPDPANQAFDSNATSRWSTGTSQEPGQTFVLDLGANHEISSIVLDTHPDQPFDYPRGYEVSVSTDGNNFGDPIATGVGSETTNISFNQTTARYVRIVQTGSDTVRYWSIYDLNVFSND